MCASKHGFRPAAAQYMIDRMLESIQILVTVYNRLERETPDEVNGRPYWCQIHLYHDEHLDTNEED